MDFAPLCQPWPVVWCCDTSTLSPAASGAALTAASELLWDLSGRQYGACEVLLRPCRRSCAGGEGPWGERSWWVGDWPTRDWPLWLDVVCGRCHGDCGCSSASTVELPLPVQQVTSVLIDGATLAASGYGLYDGRLLVRTDGGRWPLCQDWAVPVSGVGAWSVTAVYGLPVPQMGRLAVGELACEIDKACQGQDCSLPASVQSVTRGGVTQVFVDPTRLREAGLTGLRLVDQFLNAVNPTRQRLRSRVWDPGRMTAARRPSGVPVIPSGLDDGTFGGGADTFDDGVFGS